MLTGKTNGTFDDVYEDHYRLWRQRGFDDDEAIEATLDFMDATFLKLAPQYAAEYKTWLQTP